MMASSESEIGHLEFLDIMRNDSNEPLLQQDDTDHAVSIHDLLNLSVESQSTQDPNISFLSAVSAQSLERISTYHVTNQSTGTSPIGVYSGEQPHVTSVPSCGHLTSTPASRISSAHSACPVRACRSLLSAFSESSTVSVCRICHEGDRQEELFSPCYCAGTMGLLHRSCIEKWLATSGSNTCEICRHVYVTERVPKPFREWLRHPSRSTDHRNLAGDALCFLLLTPLAIVSSWLCMSGAMHYKSDDNKWESIGLILLTAFLLLIYVVWCLVAFRYHFGVWREWSTKNQVVRVLDPRLSEEDLQNNNSTCPNNNLSPHGSSACSLPEEILPANWISMSSRTSQHQTPERHLVPEEIISPINPSSSSQTSLQNRRVERVNVVPAGSSSDTVVILSLNSAANQSISLVRETLV